MVSGTPSTSVKHRYGNEASYSKETEYVAATVVECRKGEPNTPIFVTSDDQAYRNFKKRIPQFGGCGGGGAWFVRAAAGTPVKAVTQLVDTAGSPVNVIDITAKQKGDYDIYITAGTADGMNTIRIEEDGYQTENYVSPATAQGNTDMVTKINSISQIVTATSKTAGTTFTLATVTRGKLGVVGGGSPTAGSNGTVKAATTDGTLADADAPTAHQNALKTLEAQLDPLPGIVFCTKDLLTVHAKYANHASEMNTDLKSKWRIVVIGGISNASVGDRVTAAVGFNSENIWYVGGKLLGNDGNIYYSNDLAAAVAGALARFPYHESIWGGRPEKVLGTSDSVPFFYDVLDPTSETDRQTLNESGCIVFEKDKYGVKVLESVTTATPAKAETDEDEGSVTRITQKIKRVCFEAGNYMKGEKMTDTYDTDLSKKASEGLDEMVKDQALIESEEEGLKPYEITSSSVPRAQQKVGRSDISVAATVAHAARQQFINVVVR